jgi:branched-subunit amino acid aminotransferase/4-amino-4-deoxychorismate lyase
MGAYFAYRNGNWIPESELSIAVDDVGFLLGATVTERLRTFGGQVFRLSEHLERMRRSLEIVGLDAVRIMDQLAHAIPEFIARNAGKIADDDDWTINAFVTPGRSGAGTPTVCVHGWPLQFDQWAAAYSEGLPAIISDWRQVPENCWPSDLKCRSRMHYYLADQQAKAHKPGARAILLDQEGYVAESTTANVLIYRDGFGLSTPPEDHVLVGITLGVIHELAGKLGIPFMRRRITAEELRAADEVLLASTSICLLPIVECDGQPIGGGRPGAASARLLGAWSELVGLDVKAQAQQFASRQNQPVRNKN